MFCCWITLYLRGILLVFCNVCVCEEKNTTVCYQALSWSLRSISPPSTDVSPSTWLLKWSCLIYSCGECFCQCFLKLYTPSDILNVAMLCLNMLMSECVFEMWSFWLLVLVSGCEPSWLCIMSVVFNLQSERKHGFATSLTVQPIQVLGHLHWIIL